MADDAVKSESTSSDISNSVGSVTSGTASEAMIKAATASVSDPAAPASATGAATTATQTGGIVPPKPTPAATAQAERPTTSGDGIPPNRIEAAVRNARAKEAERLMSHYGLSRATSPEHVRNALAILNGLQSDPQGTIDYLIANGHIKVNGNGHGPSKTQPEESFEPELRSEDGKTAYSASQVTALLKREIERARDEMREEMRPLASHYATERQAREQLARVESARGVAQKALAQARDMPHFKEHEPAILSKLSEMDPNVRKEFGPVAAMMMAYNEVLKENVFPTIATKAAQQVRDENARKAATSRGQVSPTGSESGGKVPELNGPDALARHMERLEASMSA